MYVEPSWNSLVEHLKSMEAKRIYVAGGADSGKTTLAQFLVRTFSVLMPTAFIDCDPGQSTLGLPTTLNAGFYPTGSKEPETVLSRFIGNISPHGHHAAILLALNRLIEKMKEKNAECMIFDSSGYSIGQPAVEYQTTVIEMVQPDVVILLENDQELEPLNTVLLKFKNIVIEKLPVSQAISPRSTAARREKRELKYQTYFKDSDIQVIDVKDFALCGSLPERFTVQSMRGRLLAFCDDERFVIALGIARSFYKMDNICICQTPEFDHSKVAFLHFGDIFISPEFKEKHPGEWQQSDEKN